MAWLSTWQQPEFNGSTQFSSAFPFQAFQMVIVVINANWLLQTLLCASQVISPWNLTSHNQSLFAKSIIVIFPFPHLPDNFHPAGHCRSCKQTSYYMLFLFFYLITVKLFLIMFAWAKTAVQISSFYINLHTFSPAEDWCMRHYFIPHWTKVWWFGSVAIYHDQFVKNFAFYLYYIRSGEKALAHSIFHFLPTDQGNLYSFYSFFSNKRAFYLSPSP